LQDLGDHRVLADPFEHPFCLVPTAAGAGATAPGRIVRLVFDCFSPRTVAPFYRDLLGYERVVVDTPERVELAAADPDVATLAFQHAIGPAPRWPDPAYPEQLHLDLSFADPDAAGDRIERLGGFPLRATEHHRVDADPAVHPFCVGSLGATGPVQVQAFEAWLAAHPDEG
jgi:hypothetical protein